MLRLCRPIPLCLCLTLLTASCGQTRDSRLRQAVTFAYGDWSPSDVCRLLDEGAAVNAVGEEGLPPLLCAYGIGQDMFEDDPQHEDAVESIHLLLKAGADAQVRRLLADGVSPNAHSVDGCSALWATMPWFNLKPHSAECMELLLAAGAEVNELREGRSLMDMTMIFCGEEMEYRYRELLLQHGAVYVNPPCRH